MPSAAVSSPVASESAEESRAHNGDRELAAGIIPGNGSAPRPQRRRRRPFVLSYRAGLMLSMSVLVVGTGLALSLLAFRSARASTTKLAYSLFQEVSDHAVTKTREFLLRAVPLSQSLRNLSADGLASTDAPERMARQLSAVLDAYPGVSWISFGDEEGSFVGAYRNPAGQCRVNMSVIEGGKTRVREFDVLDNGAWKPYRTQDDSGYDPRKRDYYRMAR